MIVGVKVVGQQERIAGGERPVADAHRVAVADLGDGKVVAAQQLDERHVADGVDADEHGVVELAVGQAALHRGAAGGGDVEVGEREAVGRDEHAGAAAGARGVEHGDRRGRGPGDRRGAVALRRRARRSRARAAGAPRRAATLRSQRPARRCRESRGSFGHAGLDQVEAVAVVEVSP